MSISANAWNAIWNDGYGTGYNTLHHTSHAVVRAPSNVDLGIRKTDWDAVWNAGFQAAYGKHIAAPAPNEISSAGPSPSSGGFLPNPPGPGQDQPVSAPRPAPRPAPPPSAPSGGPVATVAGGVTSGGGGSGGAYGYDADQWHNIYVLVKVGHDLHAPGPAIVAALELGNGENSFHSYGCNSGGYCGLFQLSGSLQSEHDYHDIGYWARRAYLSGFWKFSGLINNARRYPNESPGYWVNMCQGAYNDLVQGAHYYDNANTTGHGPGLRVANTLFNYWYPRISGGAKAPAVPGGSYTTIAPAKFNPPGGATLESVVKSGNWASSFEVLWSHAQGGFDQAAKSAQTYLRNLQGHDYESPH